MKLQRFEARIHYKKEIDQMYDEGMVNMKWFGFYCRCKFYYDKK